MHAEHADIPNDLTNLWVGLTDKPICTLATSACIRVHRLS
jgi:hypothetical protein